MKVKLLLGLLLIASFLLSSKMILHGDFFFLADQARDMLLTRNIVLERQLTLIGTHSGLGGLFHGPIWLYMLVPFFILGNGNPVTFTLFYLMIPILTVLLGFIVGKKLGGSTLGLFFAFFVCVSRYMWEPVPNTISINLLPFLFILLMYFLTKFLRGEKKYFIGASFIAGLMLHFEAALPIVLAPSLFVIFITKANPFKNFRILVLSAIAYIAALLNFILFDLRHNFLISRSTISFLISGEKVNGYLSLLPRIRDHFQTLLGLYESLWPFPWLTLVSLLIIILFIFTLSYKKIDHSKEITISISFPMLVFLLFLIYPYPIYPEYVYGLMIPVAFGVASILAQLVKKDLGKALVFIFLSLISAQAVSTVFSPYQKNNTAGSYLNQKAVADWIVMDSKKQNINYFVYTPETFTYGTDYLMWWEGKVKGFSPSSQKEGDYYLVMYPSENKDAHSFWKKYVIRSDGKVLEKKEFNGGIIVEKINAVQGEREVDPNYYQNLIFR